MPLRYLLDEKQRGLLWNVVQRHNARGIDVIDAVRVGDEPDLPLGTSDPDILRWAQREQRILITSDKSSMGVHLNEHMKLGKHCPGIFMISLESKPINVPDFLVVAAHASDASEWSDWIKYIG